MQPGLPPSIAIAKRVASGMRKALRTERLLSIPMNANPKMLMIIKYSVIIKMDFIRYLLFSTSCIFIARTLQDRPKRLMKPSASW